MPPGIRKYQVTAMTKFAVALIVVYVAWGHAVQAQDLSQTSSDGGYIVATPGQPSVVRPTRGGYTVTTPSHYTVTTSGQRTVTTWGDRSVVTSEQHAVATSGQPPTTGNTNPSGR
jgi:hypothetical protein